MVKSQKVKGALIVFVKKSHNVTLDYREQMRGHTKWLQNIN